MFGHYRYGANIYSAATTVATSIGNYPKTVLAMYDNDSISGLSTSAGTLFQYATSVISSPEGEFVYTVLPPVGSNYTGGVVGDVVTSEWTDVGAPTQLYGTVVLTLDGLLTYSLGSDANFSAVPVFVEYDVTFRGKR